MDFGLAKRYKDTNTKEHIPYAEGKDIAGTVRYVSLNMHNGIEHSRRDDLESLGYVLLYLIKDNLPWQGLNIKDSREEAEAVKKIKTETSLETLCEGYPIEFYNYIKYCRELEFDSKPDYNYLKKLFSDLYIEKDFEKDGMFDWFEPKRSVNKKDKQGQERHKPIRPELRKKNKLLPKGSKLNMTPP